MNNGHSRPHSPSRTGISPGLWLAFVLTTAAMTAVSLRFGPIVGHDMGYMLSAWDHFRLTGEFNRLAVLDAGDIARPASHFVSWWSPGIQMFVGGTECLDIPVGWSMSLWNGLLVVAMLGGCSRLFQEFGLAPRAIAWSSVLLFSSWHTLYAFRQFPGADPFVMAFAPWSCLLLVRQPQSGWRPAVAITLVATFGTFLKLSFFIAAAGFAVGLVVHTFTASADGKFAWRAATKQALTLGAGLAAAWIIVHVTFLSKGPTPASPHATAHTLGAMAHAFAVSVAMPLYSTFALGSIMGTVCDVLTQPHFEANSALIIAGVFLGFASYLFAWRAVQNQLYRALLAGLIAIYVVAFTRFYFQGAAVSYEDRHFRITALLLLPGLVTGCIEMRPCWTRLSLVGLCALGAMWGAASYVVRLHGLIVNDTISHRRYSLRQVPVALDDLLHSIDVSAPAGNVLVVSPNAEVWLAVPRQRSVEYTSADTPLYGRVPNLVVILPPDHDHVGVERTFADYSPGEWSHQMIEGWTVCWTGRDALPLSSTGSR